MEVNISTADQILTTDGIPLKASLRKTERKNKIRAFLLVFPLLLFIIVTFVVPIGDMLLRSVDDSQINEVYSDTFEGEIISRPFFWRLIFLLQNKF